MNKAQTGGPSGLVRRGPRGHVSAPSWVRGVRSRSTAERCGSTEAGVGKPESLRAGGRKRLGWGSFWEEEGEVAVNFPAELDSGGGRVPRVGGAVGAV